METQFCYLQRGEGRARVRSLGKDLEKTVTDKATVVQMVKDGFAYCDDVFANADR